MQTDTASSWQARYELSTCAASEVSTAIPAGSPGIAVIYAKGKSQAEAIYLVLESRAGSLRDLCARRLATAKIPAGTSLLVAFRILAPESGDAEAVAASCREQLSLAGELRRALRPAMR